MKNGHVIISGDVLAEGKRDKVIQHPSNIPKPKDKQPEPQQELNEPENQLKTSELHSNSIPFPPTEALPPEPSKLQVPIGPEIDPQVEPNTGCGHRVHCTPGYYARLNKGLDANLVSIEESDGEVENAPEEALFAVDGDLYAPHLADYALGTLLRSELKMLDEALCTPHAKQRQTAYNYEIAQLKKLGTWELVRLPPGKTPIPHSLIFKEKLGADGNIDFWQVQPIAGGHRQTYGVNYDETFAMVAKMPSI